MLTVAVHHQGEELEKAAACAVLVDLLSGELPAQGNLETLPDLFILDETPEVWVHLCEEMLRSGFRLHTHAPHDSSLGNRSPIVITEGDGLGPLLATIQHCSRDDLLYPLETWALPATHGRDVIERRVNAFYAVGRDDALFRELLSDGAMRLTVFPSSLTLSVACDNLALAEALVRKAAAFSKLEVHWDED